MTATTDGIDSGLPCTQTSLFDSYRQALRHLHSVGRAAQPGGEPQPAAVPRRADP